MQFMAEKTKGGRMMSNKVKAILFTTVVLLLISAGIYNVMDNNKSTQRETALEVKEKNKTVKLNCDVRKYYYNQLTREEQMLYDSIEASKEKIMQNQEICIGQMESSYDEASEKAKQLMDKVVWAYRFDNPISTIWFNHYHRYLYAQNPKEKVISFDIMIKPKENGYYDFETQEELEEAIQEVQEKVDTFVSQLSGTNEQKLRAIHNWILKGAQYDDTLVLPNTSNLYGGMIQKKTICSGLTYSFKYVADKANIPVLTVIGAVKMAGEKEVGEELNHVWNEMWIDGKWYLVDLTGDLAKKPGEKPRESFFKMKCSNEWYYPWKTFKVP